MKPILWIVIMTAIVLGAGCKERDRARVEIAAAASLRHVMPELVDGFRAAGGGPLRVSYGASDDLAAQIQRGAVFDAVILAEARPVDRLIEEGLVAPSSRRVIAANTIVLVGPPATKVGFAQLSALPESSRIAIGDPKTVPAGRYAETYLRALGVWDAIQPRVVYGGDVAAVLALALRGDVQLAIVYRTDALSAKGISILDQPSPAEAPEAHIVAGVVKLSTRSVDAMRFVEFVSSPKGASILRPHGFTAPSEH
jgi:molybdate transport system substrate-binding protein